MKFSRLYITSTFSLLFILFVFPFFSNAQETFDVRINLDSILIGNTATITFQASNLEGEFEPPLMKGLTIVSGPNTSISTSYVNGEFSSIRSYSYIIKPSEPGTYFVEPAFFITNEKTYETPPLEINVFENPNDIIQQPETESPFQNDFFRSFNFPLNQGPTIPQQDSSKTPKKLRKIKRI